ncbi:hypothetical protein CEP51_009704 [Fusarium floridanum]|uniref:Uncharacterized protein n=1 Tax=Fusarium floridanum TaxID=1325733 RepID=A0A428RGR7_9HYPO|nr:hypothetical protein CEP51_009704 [Fusarium floridanum]
MPLVTSANTQTNGLAREPSKEVKTVADLSDREKEAVHVDLWSTRLPWTSAHDFIPLPTLPDKKKEQVSVPVGKLNDSLPVTPTKRKRGQAEQLDPARARVATALLSIHLNIATYDVGTLWRDGNFATINRKYVDLDEGLTMKAAIRRAILNYDQCEAARIEQYNKALIIALARLRILAFAKTGTQEIPSISDAHRVNGRIKVVELASDQLLEISTDLGDIARDCVRLRVDSLSYGAAATPYLWASEAGDLKVSQV